MMLFQAKIVVFRLETEYMDILRFPEAGCRHCGAASRI